MPMSQGNVFMGPPGLQLRAWAKISNSNTILAGSGFSGIVKNSAGQFTLTLSAALPDTNGFCTGVFPYNTINNSGSTPPAYAGSLNVASTTTVTGQTYQSGAIMDVPLMLVAVYY